MKKAIFLFLMFWKISIFSQTVGFATNINPKLKHIHAEVGTNVAVKFTEVLNYDALDFIKKLTVQTKTLNDFDFSILENNNVFSENKQREYLRDFCRKNNIDKIIVLYRNPFFIQYSPYKNLYRLKFDFGILTQERKKKVIYYMNRMILAYYDNKIDKLMHTYLAGEESLHREYYKRNSGEIVVDKESKKLINSSEVEADFIKDFENRLKQNFDEAMKK